MKKMIYLLSGCALFCTTTLFADDLGGAAAPAGRQGSFMPTLAMLAIAMAFFYIVALRPERKRRKAMEQRRSAMKKGDRVTAMGIIGTIVRVQDDTVILKMVDGAKIEMLKAAVTEFREAAPATQVVEEAETAESAS